MHECIDTAVLLSSDDLFERLSMLWPHSAAISAIFQEITNTSKQHLDLYKAFEFLSKGQQFDELLCRAARDLNPVWHCGAVLFTNKEQTSIWVNSSNKALVYHDSWTMAIWHAYRVTRMFLHIALASTYGMLKDIPRIDHSLSLGRSVTELQEYSVEVVNRMGDEICQSIPWSLSQIGHEASENMPRASRASLSIAGLRAVANSTFIHQYHTLRARMALEEIAHRFGIKGALG